MKYGMDHAFIMVQCERLVYPCKVILLRSLWVRPGALCIVRRMQSNLGTPVMGGAVIIKGNIAVQAPET